MINKSLLIILCGALLTVNSQSGEWCPAESPGKGICEECPKEYNGSISAGYDSDYVWRGFQFADESAWYDVNYTVGKFNVGVWYLQGLPGNYEETNLYASYELPSVMGFDLSLQYIHFIFNGGSDDISEVGINVGREIGGANVNFYAGRETAPNLDDWYYEISLGRTIEISEKMALEIGSTVGYWDFGGNEAGVSHRQYTASLPIQINCQLTVTPYLSYIDSMQGGPTHYAGPNAGGLFPNGSSPGDKFIGGVSVGMVF